MDVVVVSKTENPMRLISFAAGVCYDKQDSYSERRVLNCIKAGHGSVLEHAVVSLYIKGISRSCLAQLTRHRHTSFSVKSQRYVKFTSDDVERGRWYVTPPKFYENKELLDDYCDTMDTQLKKYLDAIDNGAKAEDARFLLPEATKTDLVMTTNLRELQAILKLRLEKSAQWEIRDLANLIVRRLSDESREWATLLDWVISF